MKPELIIDIFGAYYVINHKISGLYLDDYHDNIIFIFFVK